MRCVFGAYGFNICLNLAYPLVAIYLPYGTKVLASDYQRMSYGKWSNIFDNRQAGSCAKA
jgi:hypothetical protein